MVKFTRVFGRAKRLFVEIMNLRSAFVMVIAMSLLLVFVLLYTSRENHLIVTFVASLQSGRQVVTSLQFSHHDGSRTFSDSKELDKPLEEKNIDSVREHSDLADDFEDGLDDSPTAIQPIYDEEEGMLLPYDSMKTINSQERQHESSQTDDFKTFAEKSPQLLAAELPVKEAAGRLQTQLRTIVRPKIDSKELDEMVPDRYDSHISPELTPLFPDEHTDKANQGHQLPPTQYSRNFTAIQSNYRQSIPVEIIKNIHCKQPYCLEFASRLDRWMQSSCSSRVLKYNHLSSLPDGHCRFMDGTKRASVAIASYPGSGNTWVRGLLERATGICTGGIYCDGTLRKVGFTGEWVQSGVVLAVKTHRRSASWTAPDKPVISKEEGPKYGAAILLVRNPFDALVAEYHRMLTKKDNTSSSNSHVRSIGSEHFVNKSRWNTFLRYGAFKWKEQVAGWGIHYARWPILVVKFERLKQDVIAEVERMMEFLGVPYNEAEVRRRLAEDFGLFHRHHHLSIDPYTSEQRLFVRRAIVQAMEFIKAKTNGLSLGLDEYLT